MLGAMTVTGGRPPLQRPRPPSVASEPTPRSGVNRSEGKPAQVPGQDPGSGARPAVDAPSGAAVRSSSAPPDSLDPLRDAVVSSRRYGATLNGLLSAIDNFARGVEAARNANDVLGEKLDRVQELLSATEREATATRQELEERVRELEQKLRSQRKTFETERRFLTDEQDLFLRALLEEHEEELARLREERDEALALSQPPDGAGEEESIVVLRREIALLRDEREKSRALVRRMRSQRDEAQAALRRLAAPIDEEIAQPTTPAPPPFSVNAPVQVPTAPPTPAELRTTPTAAPPRPGKQGARTTESEPKLKGASTLSELQGAADASHPAQREGSG